MSERRRLVIPLLHPGSLPTRRGGLGIVLIVLLFAVAAVGGLIVAEQHHGVGPTAKTFSVAVSGGHMTPDRMEVRAGDQVVLSITGDTSETLVLQGYQKQFRLSPGVTVVGSFVATKPGTFAFVLDGSSQELAHLVVTG